MSDANVATHVQSRTKLTMKPRQPYVHRLDAVERDDPPATNTLNDMSNVGPDNPETDLGYGVDDKTGLAHEPTNQHCNDQSVNTGRTKHYQTMKFGNTKITLDRKLCKVGYKEEHKLWCWDGARWVRWLHFQKMDWNDAGWIKSLNTYREQSMRRAGWMKKRDYDHANYTAEERIWLFGLVKAAGGRMPAKDVGAITAAFNEKFGLEGADARGQGGMRSTLEKLSREYKANDGQKAERKLLVDNKETQAVAELLVGMKEPGPERGTFQPRSAAEEDAVAALLRLGADHKQE